MKTRTLILSVSLAQIMFAAVAFAPSSGADVNVIGDPQSQAFIGSGSVLMPQSIPHGSRVQAAHCEGCRWKVTPGCRQEERFGDWICHGPARSCSDGGTASQAWLALPGRDFDPVGTFCPALGSVTSVSEAAQRLSQGFVHRLPALVVDCVPSRGVVVGLPVHCRSLQPDRSVAWTDSIAGYDVHTRAEARWEWTFHQFDPWRGARWTHVVDHPGSLYPGPGVRQAFSAPGVHAVEVVARWRGSFTVPDLGTFPIESEISQSARLDLPTGSALGVIRG